MKSKDKKTTKGQKSDPIPFDSMGHCSGATCIPVSLMQQAKREGCEAFKNSRVHLLPLLRWIFSKDESEDEATDWCQELAKVKTLRERIRLAEDEGRVMDFQSVKDGLGSVMAILFGRLDRMANQLPPSLKGLDELAIKRRIEEEMESVRKDLKAKFAETTKEKEEKP